MKRVVPFFLGMTVGLGAVTALAETSDPAAARAQLQQGYALRQQGKCAEAIPHFLESVRLDRQVKAILNLADCEEKLGRLVASQSHFVEGRDLAQSERVFDLRDLAEQHLAAIEKRMPRLAIALERNVPIDTKVLRDGAELGPVSLGSSLPVDIGAHKVVVRGGGLERLYEVRLEEGELRQLEVTPTGGGQ